MFLRNKRLKVKLDLFRRCFFCKTQPLRQSRDMCVNHDAGRDPESVSEDDVRRFSSNTSERQNVVHIARNLAPEFVKYPSGCSPNTLRLVPKKAGRTYVDLEFFLRDL